MSESRVALQNEIDSLKKSRSSMSDKINRAEKKLAKIQAQDDLEFLEEKYLGRYFSSKPQTWQKPDQINYYFCYEAKIVKPISYGSKNVSIRYLSISFSPKWLDEVSIRRSPSMGLPTFLETEITKEEFDQAIEILKKSFDLDWASTFHLAPEKEQEHLDRLHKIQQTIKSSEDV